MKIHALVREKSSIVNYNIFQLTSFSHDEGQVYYWAYQNRFSNKADALEFLHGNDCFAFIDYDLTVPHSKKIESLGLVCMYKIRFDEEDFTFSKDEVEKLILSEMHD